MNLPRPTKTAIQKDGSVRYYFKADDNVHDGRYHPRGAVCWPIFNESTGRAQGHVICAAQSLSTGSIIVFEDTPFSCIDHVLSDDGNIEFEGLSSWFNAVWAKYNCNLFYRSWNDETHKQYLTMVLRSEMIKPMPGFPEVLIQDIEDAISTVFAWRTKGAIVMDTGSKLHSDLLLWENSGRKLEMPSVKAFLTLVNGYQKFRFQPKTKGDE